MTIETEGVVVPFRRLDGRVLIALDGTDPKAFGR